MDPLDWGIIAAGVLAFVFSLFSYYTYSVKGLGGSVSGSWSAWHGFFGWFAALLALVAAALLAVHLFAPQVKLAFPARLATLGLFALATLCVLLALFVVPNPGGYGGFNKGHGLGYWLSLIAIIAGTALAFLRLQRTGGALPWESKKA